MQQNLLKSGRICRIKSFIFFFHTNLPVNLLSIPFHLLICRSSSRFLLPNQYLKYSDDVLKNSIFITHKIIKSDLKYLRSIFSNLQDSFQEFLFHLPFTLEYLSPKYDSLNFLSLKSFTGVSFRLNFAFYTIHLPSHKNDNQDILSFASLQDCKHIHLNILVSNVFSSQTNKE